MHDGEELVPVGAAVPPQVVQQLHAQVTPLPQDAAVRGQVVRDGALVPERGRQDGAQLGGKPERVGDDHVLELVHHAKVEDDLVAVEELDHVLHLLELAQVAQLRHQLGGLQEAREVDALLAHPPEPPDAPQPPQGNLLPASLLHQLRYVLPEVLEVGLLAALEGGAHHEPLARDKLLVGGGPYGLVERLKVPVRLQRRHGVRVGAHQDDARTPERHVNVVLGPVEADVTDLRHHLLEVRPPGGGGGSAEVRATPGGGSSHGVRGVLLFLLPYGPRNVHRQDADAHLWYK